MKTRIASLIGSLVAASCALAPVNATVFHGIERYGNVSILCDKVLLRPIMAEITVIEPGIYQIDLRVVCSIES